MARRKRFSAEFKRQALRRAAEPGMTDALVCTVCTAPARSTASWSWPRALRPSPGGTADAKKPAKRLPQAPVYPPA